MNKQRVVLETIEGTAFDEEVLEQVWNMRIKQFFPHYRLVSWKFMKEKGKQYFK